MKFSVSQSDLDNAIGAAIRAVPKKTTHPILANILLEADLQNQQLIFTGFDLSLAIVTICKAEVEVGGKITLPASLFPQIISKVDGDIVFELTQNNIAKIISGKSSYSMPVMLADEYPQLPTITGEDVTRVELNPEIVIQGLRHTLFAASNEETKQLLTGVHLQLEENIIRFIATDGHRCAVYQSDYGEEKESGFTSPQACQVTIKKHWLF